MDTKELQKTKKAFSGLLMFILLFSTLSGAIRKWAIANNTIGNLFLLVQLLLPYSFMLLGWKVKVISPFKKYFILYIYLFLLVLLALSPMNLTIYHGILGVLLHFGFWYMLFFYFSNRQYFEINAVVRMGIVLCFLEVLLGAVQYNLPDTHVLNRYADPNQIQNIAKVGDRVRITGTFSYLGGMASFIVFYAFLLWVMIRKRINKQLLAMLMVFGLVVSFMTSSRGVVATYVFILLLMVISEYKSSAFARKIVPQLAIFLLAATIVLFFLGDRFGVVRQADVAWQTFNNRVQSNRQTGEEKARFTDLFTEVLDFKGNYPVLGVGLGSTYQGATAVFGTSSYVLEYGYYESEWGRLVLEGGFVLFFFRIVLYVALLRRLALPRFTKFVLVVYLFVFMPIVFNLYNAIFLFLALVLLDKTYSPEAATDKQPFLQPKKYAGAT